MLKFIGPLHHLINGSKIILTGFESLLRSLTSQNVTSTVVNELVAFTACEVVGSCHHKTET